MFLMPAGVVPQPADDIQTGQPVPEQQIPPQLQAASYAESIIAELAHKNGKRPGALVN